MKITPGGEGDLELRLAGKSTSVWLNLSGQDEEFLPTAGTLDGAVASCSTEASSVCLSMPTTRSPLSLRARAPLRHHRRPARPMRGLRKALPAWLRGMVYGALFDLTPAGGSEVPTFLAPSSDDESFDTTRLIDTAMSALLSSVVLVTAVQHARSRANPKTDVIAPGTSMEDKKVTVGSEGTEGE